MRAIARAASLCALGALCASPAAAFEGRVTLPDGTPVADATISILGRSGASRTGPDGTFRWEPDPPVPFELLVSMAGGSRPVSIRVEEIPAGAPLRLTVLTPEPESITVTAEAAPHLEAPPAAALTTLPREEIAQRRPARLADVTENIPGVSRSVAGHDGVASIRGLARGRTLVLLDGARVTTERRAGANAGFLDPFFLESVEVARGPGSVAYGSDALGGVLLARTPRAEPGAPLRARAIASLGSGIPERGAGFELSRGLEEGGWLLQGRCREFSDYRAPSGRVPNSSAEDCGGLARFEHEAGPGILSFGWQSDLARDLERSTIPANGTRTAYPREDSHRLTWSFQRDPLPDSTLLGFEGFAGRYRLVTEQDRPASATAPRQVSLSDVRADDAALRARVVKPIARARVEGGLDLNGRFNLQAIDTDPNGIESTSIEEARRNDLGAYVTTEVAASSSIRISGGARYDFVSSRSRGGSFGARSNRDGSTSGFVSLAAGPFRGVQLTGQVARGFRDPTLSDRYFEGISGRGFVTGNPDLEPETSLQYDAALRYAAARFRGALYSYHYRIEDLIERFQTGEDPNTQQALFSFRNLGEALLRGVELELQADLPAGVRLELGAQTARGEDGDGSPLDDVPSRQATLVVRSRLGDRGDLYARTLVAARDDRPGPTERETPAYSTLDLGGGWRLGAGLELRLQVRNLFDREYPAGQDENAPPAAGRSALLTLTAALPPARVKD